MRGSSRRGNEIHLGGAAAWNAGGAEGAFVAWQDNVRVVYEWRWGTQGVVEQRLMDSLSIYFRAGKWGGRTARRQGLVRGNTGWTPLAGQPGISIHY